MKKFLKENIVLLISIVLITILIVIFANPIKDILRPIDIFVESNIQNIRSKNLTSIMKFISFLGSAYTLIPISIIALLITITRKRGVIISCNLAFICLLNQLLKFIVKRSRPVYMIIKETGYSFPSGHAMTNMAFYGLLIYLIYKGIKNDKTRKTLSIFIAILILLIGFSRIYLGVHYFSDVCAGFIIAFTYLILLIRFIKCLNIRLS